MDHRKEIAAWSYIPRTAHTEHMCRLCKDKIPIGRPYLDITVSDNVTPSSEKLTHQAEHHDCSMPWYIPADKSPTTALARIRVPMNIANNKASVRYELAGTSSAGTTVWQAPDKLHLGLELQSKLTRASAIAEINNMHAILNERIMNALGSKKQMRELGNEMLQLQAGLNQEPDLSRFQKKPEK